jgi:lysophospholipase L1-like esterase
MAPADVERLAETNDALAALAKARGFYFVSTAEAPITSRGGSLSEELSEDEFHLDAQGYRQLARCILEQGGEVGRRLSP